MKYLFVRASYGFYELHNVTRFLVVNEMIFNISICEYENYDLACSAVLCPDRARNMGHPKHFWISNFEKIH